MCSLCVFICVCVKSLQLPCIKASNSLCPCFCMCVVQARKKSISVVCFALMQGMKKRERKKSVEAQKLPPLPFSASLPPLLLSLTLFAFYRLPFPLN